MTACTCEANAPGITLCHADVSSLEWLLGELDVVVEDLLIAVPRASLTASYGERVSSSGSLHAPLPVNEAALDSRIALDRYLMQTALELAKVTQVPLATKTVDGRRTANDTKALSSYIYKHIPTLRTLTFAPDVEPTLRCLVRDCEKATRTATQAEFAGTCPEDGTELFTHKGGQTATCRTCSTVYENVQDWRTDAKAYARQTDDEVIGYPKALSERLAKVHGETITPQHIRLLASKEAIHQVNPVRGDDGRLNRPMYRLGDIKNAIKPTEEAA